MSFDIFLQTHFRKLNWLEQYTLFLLSNNKKIIHLNSDISEFYMIYSIYHSFILNKNLVFVVDSTINSINSFINLLNDTEIPNIIHKNKIFINDSCIELIPINMVTNKILKNKTVIIDVYDIRTKISDYLIFRSFLDEKIDNILCSIKHLGDNSFFNNLIIEDHTYKIPIILL